MNPPLPGERINILDWGCGRWRSVAKLREQGFNAYGVDIDDAVMRNGYALFEGRNLNPRELLLPDGQALTFPNGNFDIVFSEQVLEHATDLRMLFAEISRLTRLGGLGVHCFPGSRSIIEEHLHMPCVQWLPANNTRRAAIAFLMRFGCGPKQTAWPSTIGKGFLFKVNANYAYLNQRTCYRDIEEICQLAAKANFATSYDVEGNGSFRRRRFLPHCLRRNAFPLGSIQLILTKNTD